MKTSRNAGKTHHGALSPRGVGAQAKARIRPLAHLEAVARDYPGAWKYYAEMISRRHELSDWPAWCYCPLGAAEFLVATHRGRARRP